MNQRKPDTSKWIVRKVAGRWVTRMPDDLGGWKFTLPTWDTCMVLVEGVEIYRHKFHLTDGWMFKFIRNGQVAYKEIRE